MSTRETYEVLSETLDDVRDRWTMQVCPECFGRRNEKDAHPSWPKCECPPKPSDSPSNQQKGLYGLASSSSSA